MMNVGIPSRSTTTEVAPPSGRDRHEVRHPVSMADKVMWYKYIVKNVAP